MKVFLEYIPLLLFVFIAYLDERMVQVAGIAVQIGGIYSATAFLMAGTVLVYGFFLIRDKGLSRMQWVVVCAVLLFGSTTLLLHSENIIKWKAPVVNWIFALVFLLSQFFTDTNMAKRMFGQMVTMPDARWTRLNLGWALTFFIIGTANLYVAFTYQDWWVKFKVFGSLAMLLVATVVQIIYIYPYMEDEEDKENQDGNPDSGQDSV